MIRSNTSPKRSTLAVPGSSEKMLEKAKSIEVDEIFLDLEDSVALTEKNLAREKVIGALINGGFKSKTVAVRVNEQSNSIGIEDVSSIVLQAGKHLNSLIIPKVESAEQVKDLSKRLSDLEKSAELNPGSIRVQIQIESALGLSRVGEIASSADRIEALIFGPGDFAASVGMQVIHIGENPINFPGDDAYHYVLMSILIAARANNLMAIDGPYSDISSVEGLANRSKLSAALGYDGKWVIHPGQIETVNTAFTPSQRAFDGAARIIEHFANESTKANQKGALLFEGKMIDEASRKMAEGLYVKGIASGLVPSTQGDANG
jgi:citrate lyase subunit beta/citryl-CoA lyase